jgi:hypothetical protein
MFYYRLGTSKGESILYNGPPGIGGVERGGKVWRRGEMVWQILAGENPAASLGSKHRWKGPHSLSVRRRKSTGSKMSEELWGTFRGLDVLQQELNKSAEIMSE